MTVKQALKEKNKLTKLISTLVVRLQKYNSVEEGAIRTYSPKENLDKLQKSVSDLVFEACVCVTIYLIHTTCEVGP